MFLKPFGFIGGGADTTAPAVASFSVGTQASDGDIPISVGAITEAGSPDDLTLGYVVTGTDQSAATRAQVKTAAEGGAALTDQLDIGTFAITTAGGTFNEALTAGIDDATAYVQAVVWDAAGNISTVQADGPVDIDTTAPTLSSPTGTQTGQTTADWGVTSNEASGTIYAGVRPTASAALTAAQLVAGSGGAGVAWNSDATPTADATNGGSFTGLTAAEAYKVDIVQVDAVGNTSAVSSSAEFTTASAAGITVTYLGESIGPSSDATSYTISGATLGTGKILLSIAGYHQPAGDPELTVTIDGVTATVVTDGVTNAAGENHDRISVSYVWADSTSATGDIVASQTTGNFFKTKFTWYLIEGTPQVDDVTVYTANNVAAPAAPTLDVNTLAGGAVFASSFVLSAVDYDNIVGVTSDGTVPSDAGTRFAGSATGLSAETPRTVTIGDTSSFNRTAQVAISISAA